MSERTLIANASLPCPANLLDSDERAIWWDCPDRFCYARQQAGRAIFIGFFFAAGGSFMTVKAIEDRSLFATLFCLVFVAVGLYAMSEPIRRYVQAPRVVYLLTEKRAVVADEQVIKSVLLPSIKSIEVAQTGTRFGDVLYFDRVLKGSENDDLVRDGFIGIADAEAVAREMRRLQAATS